MLKKLLAAAVFAAMTATASATTAEQDIEQIKILVAECQKAGLSQKEALQLIAEQTEKKTLSNDETFTSTATKILIANAIIAIVVTIIIIVWKNAPDQEDVKTPLPRIQKPKEFEWHTTDHAAYDEMIREVEMKNRNQQRLNSTGNTLGRPKRTSSVTDYYLSLDKKRDPQAFINEYRNTFSKLPQPNPYAGSFNYLNPPHPPYPPHPPFYVPKPTYEFFKYKK